MSENVLIELSLPKTTYLTLKRVARKIRKTEADIMLDALRVYLERLAKVDPFLGLFANDPEMVDQIVTQVMLDRTTTPLRLDEAVRASDWAGRSNDCGYRDAQQYDAHLR